MKPPTRNELEEVYRRLFKEFGPQHWWPGQTKWEIMVGAVLTQNTNWGNVERAIRNLREEKVLTLKALRKISLPRLARLIRPSGYFNIKARRLKNLVNFIFAEYSGSLVSMAHEPLADLRKKLLSVNGIGPETADSILLYAFNKPIFVVDAYTRRLLSRHNWTREDIDYHDLQNIFMTHLKPDVQKFNEYHALIVRAGKELCRTNPKCAECPLKTFNYSANFQKFLDARGYSSGHSR